MTPKQVYAVLFSIIVLLIVFSFSSRFSSSQTCASCGEACPINCGETLSERKTDTSEYFYFTLTSYTDVNITMTPNSTIDYNLYFNWKGDCPYESESEHNCKPGNTTGVQEICQNSSLSPGTYYIRVRWYYGDGKYNISLSCSEATTTTTTTTTTSSTTTSSTTTSETTSTTESTTTSTISSTTTTTTLPTVSLQCEKNEIYVKQKNRCNVTNCQEGYWLVKNYDGTPLSNETIEDIPPDEIEFGPTIGEGEVLTRVVCLNPSLTVNHRTLVKKGPVLVCPDTCYLDESCKCEVEECNNGLFLMDNYEGEPLTGDVIKDVNETIFQYDFRVMEEGKIRVRMICHEPYETEETVYINISYPVTTTTLPREFDVSKKTCTKDEFVVSVGKNTRIEDTFLYVQLIKEPEGIIYYADMFDVRSGFEGDKTLSLTKIKDCPSGTDLKLLVLAYSSTLQRVDRLKEVAFQC